MQLRRQASGGVRHDDIDIARVCGIDRIENHRGGVPRLLRDDGDVVALSPALQLLARRGAKGVAGRQQNRLAAFLKMIGQLADRGGFSGAVDADQHDDKGPLRIHCKRHGDRRQHVEQRGPQCAFQFMRFAKTAAPRFVAQALDQEFAGAHTDIGRQQGRFEFLKKRIVDFAAGKQVSEIGIQDLARARQPVTQAPSPAAGRGFLLFAFEETKHAVRGQ